jgi:hypothetical protein
MTSILGRAHQLEPVQKQTRSPSTTPQPIPTPNSPSGVHNETVTVDVHCS